MINHKKKFIFIHIPKTAGVSVYDFLGDTTQQNHKTLLDYEDYYRSYFSFAVVRNPWDRLVSAYSYMKTGGRGFKGDLYAQKVVNKYTDFKDFSLNLKEVQAELSKFVDANNGKFIVGFPHLLKQSRWTHNGNRQIVDFIIRLETLDSDFNKIKAILGKWIVRIPNKNSSCRKNYSSYYDDDNMPLVAEFYKEDFDNFGYSINHLK